MAWKRKEKKLSPEEAIALAKKELAPFWFGCKPMLAAVKMEGKVSVHPLDQEFAKRAWLLFFIDITEFPGKMALQLAKVWFKRYGSHGVGFLAIFQPRYSFLRDPAPVKPLIEKERLNFPCVLDSDGGLSAAFGIAGQSKIILFNEGQNVFEHSFMDWDLKTEETLQIFLRERDPGLPLLRIYEGKSQYKIARTPMEMGAGRGAAFPKPGFAPGGPGGFSTGSFQGQRPPKLGEKELFISGKWLQDGERIATSDPHASIGVRSSAQHFSMVAQSLAKREAAKVLIEVSEKPAFDVFAGENLTFSDNGQSLVKVMEGNLYHVLAGLPAAEREITLLFPQADEVPVAIYGFRFSD